MKILTLISLFLATITLVRGYIYGGSIYSGGFSPFQQFGGGWQYGGFNTPFYGQGYYNEPITHVHYDDRGFGGGLFGGISQRDLFAGVTGAAFGALFERRRQQG